MNVSIIFSTYNSPAWLEKVLWGFECQTYADFEIGIADGGSGEPTPELIESFKKTHQHYSMIMLRGNNRLSA